MELENSFVVDVDVDRAWQVLTDIPAIAPCLPGAQLQEVDGEEYKGVVKVKVGPIVAQYKGAATVQSLDESEHRIELVADGRETRGQGSAKALITATLEDRGGSTEVVVRTDLTVTGKVAQFGRGVMADVSSKLMDQFATNLGETVLAEPTGEPEAGVAGGIGEGPSSNGGTSGGSQPVAAPGGPVAPEPEPIDLLGTAGVPMARRIVPPLVGALLALLVIRWLVRRARG